MALSASERKCLLSAPTVCLLVARRLLLNFAIERYGVLKMI
jgi:hypothetical protein